MPDTAETLPPNTVSLVKPLRFANGTEVPTLTLTRPNVRTLRGISLVALTTMDVDALLKLLPRIAQPSLTPQMLDELDPADLMAIADLVMGFLLDARPSPAA
jgi:hypothetical protein